MTKIVSYNRISDMLINGSVNFIAIVITPWHYVGIQAAIARLKNEGKDICPIVVFGKHEDTGFAVNIEELGDNCYLLDDGAVPSTGSNLIIDAIRYHKSQHSDYPNTVYLFSAWNYSITRLNYFFSIYPARYILGKVDEGVATYMSHRSLSRKLTSWVIQSTLRNNYNFNLFLEQGGRLKPNKESIKWYKKILSSGKVGGTSTSKVVLIATPCFEDKPEEDMELHRQIKKIIDNIVSKGYDCVLKPHPRERHVADKYANLGCKIIDKSVSLEEYMANFRPLCIVSTSSTVLVTAKLLYDVSPVSIVRILDKSKFSQRHCDEMNSFEKVFSDIVIFPDNIEEVAKNAMLL